MDLASTVIGGDRSPPHAMRVNRARGSHPNPETQAHALVGAPGAWDAPPMAHALTAAVSAPSRRWPQRPEIVSRERLVQRLAQARDVPLALLIAPAGYGKTTLLEDWAAHDGRPFAWATLSNESNDPARLLARSPSRWKRSSRSSPPPARRSTA